MKRALTLLMLTFLSLTAADKKNPRAGEIPKGGNFNPKEEIPVFVVSSKHGMRIMISKDDGQSWQESFLGTSDQNTGGGHGPWDPCEVSTLAESYAPQVFPDRR